MVSVSDPINGEWPYQPLTLGRYVRKQPPPDGQQARKSTSRSQLPQYEAWREKTTQLDDVQLETQPEALLLDEVRREAGRASWVQPVLGEPGAGKSRLLREWALRLTANPAAEPFAFVPLRRLVAPDYSLVGEALAVRLLDVAAETARAVRLPHAYEGRPSVPRVWLLDGLDELPETRWESGLSDALTALPGPKVATCRTGVFGGWRQRLGEGVGAQWRKEVEILPLGVHERRAFLAARLPDREAEALVIHIEAFAALRELAGSPLLLGLMAELGLPLPNSRAAFYERTEARLGARRSQGPQHDLVWARSGAVLDRLADTMKLDRSKRLWLFCLRPAATTARFTTSCGRAAS